MPYTLVRIACCVLRVVGKFEVYCVWCQLGQSPCLCCENRSIGSKVVEVILMMRFFEPFVHSYDMSKPLKRYSSMSIKDTHLPVIPNARTLHTAVVIT